MHLLTVTVLAGIVGISSPAYTEEDLWYMSHIVQAEAGFCSIEMMEGVASVVMNRVNDERFPDSVKEVIEQPGQYSPLTNGTFWNEPTDEVVEVSKDILQNGSVFPENVVWQANFPQGDGTYTTISTNYSTMYFCY